MSAPRSNRPQRANLRFCKAFFEIEDRPATHDRLLAAGAQELVTETNQRWYLWNPPDAMTSSAFLVRTRGPRLVLEGPDAGSVGRAWRQLNDQLQPAARARVAVGDDLSRFVPKPRRRTADRPESFSAEHEAQVLAEFHAALCVRWADAPQQRLNGMTPRQAASDRAGQSLLEELLRRMRIVEEERRSRGMASVSVDELERSVFNIDGLVR
jgi:hypothetical protein